MNVTVLIENEAADGLVGEHGLALWIAYRGKRYLLDTGESGDFLKNADALHVPAHEAEAVFISQNPR